MTLLQLFKAAFTQHSSLIHAKDKTFWKTTLYILFLGTLLCIPLVAKIPKVVRTIQTDIQEISTKLPEFSITNQKLTTEAEDSGFIYQTDYLIFTFDPDAKRQASDIKKDLIGNVIGIGLLQDKFVFAVTDDNLLASMLPSAFLEFPYESANSAVFNKDWLNNNIQSPKYIAQLILVAFLIGFLPITLSLLLTLLMISLVANIFSKMRLSPLKFGDNFKIVTFSATLPVILATMIMLILPVFNPDILLMVATVFIYTRVVKPTLPKKDDLI